MTAQMTRIARLLAEPGIAELERILAARLDYVIDEALAIQQIPAPTFDEGRRAVYVQGRCRQLGLEVLEIDAVNNVYARLPGRNPALPALLLAAHTDTVFDLATPLTFRREEGKIWGPGLGDNSLGVAAVLALAGLFCAARFPRDVWFVANSREEGLGDLGGMRAVYERLKDRLGAALIIEGMAFGRIYHCGIAVRRLRISCHGPGGHSWLHFGRPSAIHGLLRLGAQIAALQPPETPRTTYNIGVIEGGTTVNSIASEASLLLDMRSEQPETLATLEKTVLALVERGAGPELTFQVQVVGDRPAGSIPRTHGLVCLARDVLESLGIQPGYETGSTDANALLAHGLPAITVGVTQGGNAHRIDEYIETASIQTGLWQLALLASGAALGLAE